MCLQHIHGLLCHMIHIIKIVLSTYHSDNVTPTLFSSTLPYYVLTKTKTQKHCIKPLEVLCPLLCLVSSVVERIQFIWEMHLLKGL